MPPESRGSYMCVFDFETTGLHPIDHEVIEVAAVVVDPWNDCYVIQKYEAKVIPTAIEKADPEALKINGYTPEKWTDARPAKEVFERLGSLMGNCIVCGHNVDFDLKFLMNGCGKHNVPLPIIARYQVDTMNLAWPLFVAGKVKDRRLATLCDFFGVPNDDAHTALADVRRTVLVYKHLLNHYQCGGRS